MDIDRLRYFCVLARTSNMREAAGLLHLSPPALSKAMRVLEGEMGYRLLAPAGRGIVITDRGRVLAERAAPLLERFQALREPADRSGAVTPLRLGSFEVFTTYFLGEALARHLPDRPLIVHELIPGQLEEALSRRQVDLGITYLPIPAADLDHVRVAQAPMGIYGRKDAGFDALDFPAIPFAVPVSPISGSPSKVQGLDGWPDDRIPRFAKYRVTLMESALELCRRGLAVAYLPEFVARLHNERAAEKYRLRAVARPPGLATQAPAVYLVKRKSDLEDAAFRKLARAVRQVLAK